MTYIRHTEFAPFVLDLVDFMEKKIRMGLDDEGARAKAVGDAAGVAPLLHGRLCENEAGPCFCWTSRCMTRMPQNGGRISPA